MIDGEVLEALYHATGGAEWSDHTNWLSKSALSEWFGVGTDESGRVTSLDLWGNGLRGEIPPELGQLSQLQSLNLEFNGLSGTIPPELGRLSRLQRLSLGRNHLSGGIPPELAGLSSLQLLNLGYNYLRGEIPPELGRLSRLQWLYLNRNLLNGGIPLELVGLTRLQSLDLNSNRLSGGIPPDLAGMSNLQVLNLGRNLLSGAIPVELAGLTNLNLLSLDSNDLSGAIPPELAGLTNLRYLQLAGNRLTGAIPVELAGLTSLYLLSLDSNNLSGAIPPELAGLTNLRFLRLAGNRLTGAIPPELGQLTHLRGLDLAFNQDLTGTIPRGLQQLPLSSLYLMATAVCVSEEEELQEWLATLERFTSSGLTCGRPPAAMSSIDIAVFYTLAARRYVGGTAEMEAEIDLKIAETNQAYVEGGVNQRLVLVAREEVPYDEENTRGDPLRRLADPSDGYMDEVHAIRDQAGADLVHLIANAGNVAYLAGAFGMSSAGPDSRPFAHELGHNMGLHHERYIQRNAPLPFSHGYVNQQAFVEGAPGSAGWFTIMAYGTQCHDAGLSCGPIMRFSNPNQTYLGDPLGVQGDERGTVADGPADAVRALNHTRHSVGAFRPRASGTRLTMPTTLSQTRPVVGVPANHRKTVLGDGLFLTLVPNERGAASRQAGSAADHATLRRRHVRVDIETLQRLSDTGSTTLRLNLFDDVVLMGIIERRTPTFSGGFALSGRLVGVPEGSMTLVVNGSLVAGSVRLPDAIYGIRPDGAGQHAITQVDPSQHPQGCTVVKQSPDRQ